MSTATRTPTLIRRRLLPAAAVMISLTLVLTTLGAAGAHAQVFHPRLVSQTPAEGTPHLRDGTVHAIAAVGDQIVVGGTFTEAEPADRQSILPRRYLMAFHRHTGAISNFSADLDGPVYSLAPGPSGTVYVGGSFKTVNGDKQRGVTQLRISDGARVSGFQARINWGNVRTLARHQDRLYLGGAFTAVNGTERIGLARVSATTGALDPGFDAQLRHEDGDLPSVQDVDLTADGRRLAVVGAFTIARGLLRPQILIMDTGGPQASLANWYTDIFDRRCSSAFRTYLRGVDFAPDGSYLVTVTTGGMTRPDHVCNTALRLDTVRTGMHRPVWVNHTGGHSLYSVEVTGAGVYVGGHQRWQDNPEGNKSAGPGAVERKGIAALHPGTGSALPWNPGRKRGVGVESFLATPDGLFVGSDTAQFADLHRGRLAMLPLP